MDKLEIKNVCEESSKEIYKEIALNFPKKFREACSELASEDGKISNADLITTVVPLLLNSCVDFNVKFTENVLSKLFPET